jgi:hypothetical protein
MTDKVEGDEATRHEPARCRLIAGEGAWQRRAIPTRLTWVSFDPIPDVASDINFGIRKLADLGLLSGTVRGVRHVHAHRDSGDGNDDFSFHLNLSGLSTVESGRGESTLRDGDSCC